MDKKRCFTTWLLIILAGLSLTACSPAPPEPVSPVSGPPVSPLSSPPLGLPGDKPTGKLSARLQVLADPAVSQQAVVAQAQAVGLPASGPGSLLRNERGDLLVQIRLSDTSGANQQALAEAGATLVNVAEAYRTVTAYVSPAQLTTLTNLAIVENIQEEVSP